MNPDQVSAALDRAYRAVAAVTQVTTDGHIHYPASDADTLAAELGYVRRGSGAMDDPFGSYAAEDGITEWKRRYRLQTILRVLDRAGADTVDIEVLREATGIGRGDDTFVNQIDVDNEASRQYWLEQYQRQRAIEIENVRRDERLKVLAEFTADESDTVDATPFPTVDALTDAADGQLVTLAGELAGVTVRVTKQGRTWASAELRDATGQIELLIFPAEFERSGSLAVDGKDVRVMARMDRRDDTPRLMAKDVQEMSR